MLFMHKVYVHKLKLGAWNKLCKCRENYFEKLHGRATPLYLVMPSTTSIMLSIHNHPPALSPSQKHKIQRWKNID